MQGLSECRVFAAPGVAAPWRRFAGSNGTLVRRARLLFYGLAAVAMRVPGLGRSDGIRIRKAVSPGWESMMIVPPRRSSTIRRAMSRAGPDARPILAWRLAP